VPDNEASDEDTSGDKADCFQLAEAELACLDAVAANEYRKQRADQTYRRHEEQGELKQGRYAAAGWSRGRHCIP